MNSMYLILELLGTVAFAISGATVGIEAKMDIFGATVLGLTTATGGGIIRDLIIGNTPPNAFKNPIYSIIAIVTSLVVCIPYIKKRVDKNSHLLNLVDAIGLALFTVVGVEMGMEHGGIFLQLFLGVITGVGGGVLRDLFAIKTPEIFVKNFYATPSIIGAATFILMSSIDDALATYIGAVVIVVLRVLAAKYGWHLPKT